MSQLDLPSRAGWQSFNTAAASSVTCTLVAPSPSCANSINWITASSTGATVAEIQVTKNDGTTMINRIGGAGTVALTTHTFAPGTCVGAKGDATKVILITTSGNPSNITVGYDAIPM